jgi:hypothetical protein
VTLSDHHTAIVARGLSQLPLADRDCAVAYVESILRPIREVRDSDVRHAVGAALVKYQS